ncbi:hypothetical protein [Chitinophaga sp. ARDCPP14]|uniref:hypothetical protein n=1 Tax=Chitinophaga sp. ARDCPP14 TaxID=3391139 RepID=UPI003F51FCAD
MQKEIIIKISSGKSNAALDLHTLFSALPTVFREYVCEECNWSTPTFYRKLRTKDMVNPENPKRVISAISKAEKDKIIEIGLKVFEKAGMYISKYNPQTSKQ